MNIKTLPVIPDPPSVPRQVKSRISQAYAIELEWGKYISRLLLFHYF
jgi:hypothetical protein